MGCLIIATIALSAASAEATIVDQAERDPVNAIQYRLERVADIGPDLKARFTPPQLELLEKLNRVDVTHLRRMPHPPWISVEQLTRCVSLPEPFPTQK